MLCHRYTVKYRCERDRSQTDSTKRNVRMKFFRVPQQQLRHGASGGPDGRLKTRRNVKTVISFGRLVTTSCAVLTKPCRRRFGYESSREKSSKSNGPATFRL